MTPSAFTVVFLILLAASLALQLWLARRHALHVAAHRDAVPTAFADRVRLPAHQKAADYTVARTRLGMIEVIVETALLVALTVGGGLAVLVRWTGDLPLPGLARDLALIVAVAVISGIVALPFSYVSTFVIEAKFGFNRMTRALWLADLAKGIAVAAALGLPLAALVLWLMRVAGPLWWIWAWAAWVAFQLLVLALYPTVIAPLFNKFSPLPAGSARDAIEALLARCGFENRGLYVMDGSRRSSHGNAFFTGFGRAKRIVFFDTLLERLTPDEIEAVLAHELGHFRLKHVLKRMLWSAGFRSRFSRCSRGSPRRRGSTRDWACRRRSSGPGVALILFFLALPAFTFVFAPLSALYSRRHEFEADAFAAQHASAASLIHALVKLFEDNAATLTPDPYYSAFHDSHPPAALRVARLESA